VKVLFVCAGNICRSPMAEALFRHHAAFHASLADVEVRSAGVIAMDGSPAFASATAALRDACALEIGRHRARRLLPGDESDLVLSLDRWVFERVERLQPRGRHELLGDYAGVPGREVTDPYDGPMEGYLESATVVQTLVRAAVARLARERAAFDLDAYLARVRFTRSPRADEPTLRALHRAHVQAIPFENVDVRLGRPIRLDLTALQEKLVHRRRGGYCFEQNTLFLHALRAIGFDADACEARVRPESGQVLPRTHMVLVVRTGAGSWLCDVGFGADGLLEPARLDATEQVQGVLAFRVSREGPLHVLQSRGADESWVDGYAFLPEARYPTDFEVANWYTSTWPQSRFVLTTTAQRATAEERHALRGLRLTSRTRRGTSERQLSHGELGGVLRTLFDLDLDDADVARL
jgi:N-hydroxyarylamine O-acetyltransferase